jgi:hypothetical protein
LCEDLRERDHFGYLGEDWSIILKCILKTFYEINLDYDRGMWLTLVNAAMNIQVP